MVRSILRWALIVTGLILSGILVAAVVILYGEYSETHWVPPTNWIGLALFTIFVFGTAISEYSRSWRSLRFWGVMTALLIFHLLAYSILLESVAEWRVIWFAFITMIELPVIGAILFSLGFPYAPLRRRRRSGGK